MIYKRVFAATFLTLLVTSAQAADPAVEIDDAVFGWGGLYAGAHIGYGRGNTNTTGLTNGAFDQGAAGNGHVVDADPDGVFGGVQIGYNWAIDNVVIGIEADAGYLGTDDAQIGFPNAIPILTDTGIVTEYGAYGVLAGRVGVARDRTLLYLKGGLAIADIDVTAGDLDGAPPAFDISDTTRFSDTRVGYTIGAGLEYAFRGNWSLKAEYLYMDFGSTRTADPDGNRYETDFDLHTFKVGLNYRF